MADPVDIANETVEVFLAASVHRAVGKSAPESHPDFDGVRCVECDEKIPALRLALGKVRCVDCQIALEETFHPLAARNRRVLE
ncbi:MAG: TraR/DksA C4-type zinc finger protein [Acidobacteriaceae bacterium]